MQEYALIFIQAGAFLTYTTAMSVACFITERDGEDDEIDAECGVYGYSRMAFGNLIVLLLLCKVFLMATGIADLHGLMTFDLPRRCVFAPCVGTPVLVPTTAS